MPRYLATVKLVNGGIPSKYKFSADGITAALKKMVEMSGVTSSMDLDSYDLLEIKEDEATGIAYGYVPVSEKESSKAPSGSLALEPSPPKPEPKAMEETTYCSYELEEA